MALSTMAGIAVVGYVLWSKWPLGPGSPDSAPPSPEAGPSVPAQSTDAIDDVLRSQPEPTPSAPGPESAIERRLSQARECLLSGDYGCGWRSIRYVLDREPDNSAALSIEQDINRYVDARTAEFERAIIDDDLAEAQRALSDAQRALNYDRSDPRLDAMTRRLEERAKMQQRRGSEMQPPAPPRGTAADTPDPMVQELLSEAQQSLERGNLDAAESFAYKVLRRDEGNSTALEILRRAAAEKQRIKDALMQSTEIKEAVKVN